MTTSLLRHLAVLGAFAFVFAASSAHAQTSLSSGIALGGDMTPGQSRSWAFNVPAGNYLAIGRISYRLNGGQDSASLFCELKRGSGSEFWDIGDASVSGDVNLDRIIEGELTLLGQIPMPTAGSLAIMCRAGGGTTGARRVHHVRLELISVQTIGDLSQIDTSGPAPPHRDLRNNAGVQRRRN